MEIEKLIQNQIEDIDYSSYIRQEIRSLITGDIKREIHEVIKNRIEELINLEIDIVMSGEVLTDDGWGKKGKHNSFADLFKATFKSKLESSWDIKRLLETKVKERVSMLFEQNKNEAIEKVVDAMTKSKLVKK